MTLSEVVRCVTCGKRLSTVGVRPTWFHCSTCGKPVCIDCRKVHIPICMAETWGMAKRDEKGDLKAVEKPPVWRI